MVWFDIGQSDHDNDYDWTFIHLLLNPLIAWIRSHYGVERRDSVAIRREDSFFYFDILNSNAALIERFSLLRDAVE